ncbi:ABC transporter permease [Bacillus sp. DJP31]|uniref:ABC transporter permease n=1 Tax=Bacillus sp. DJP31 TaxID=3409789 RepID=UPI003BB557CF
MMKKLLTQPMFLIGFLIISALLVSSFVYTAVYKDEVPKTYYVYNEEGALEASSPLSPNKDIWFGTDALGLHMLNKMIIGAKYTIIAAFIIAFLRVAVAIPLGVLFSSYLTRFRKNINGFIDSFHYIPLSLIAYYILYPVLWMGPEGFQHSFFERVSIEVMVLTMLTVPILAVLIGNESSSLMKKDFIISAQTLGASKLHIIRRHILPSLREKFVIMFGQQVIQVLLILSHLGLLHLFFGGTVVSYDLLTPDPPTTFSMEWSGLIGDAQRYLQTAIWIPLTPILFFAITIYAVNLMTEGFTKVSTGEGRLKKKSSWKMTFQGKNQSDVLITAASFERKQNSTKTG